MKTDNEIIESAIAGGLIGSALGALISKSSKGASIGAIAGAALFASLKANENALKTGIPVLVEENGTLYELSNDGSKKFVKNLPKNNKKIPQKFTLL